MRSIVDSDHSGRGGFQQVVVAFLLQPGLPFASVLSPERVERVLAKHGGLFGQNAVFSPVLTLWAFLGQVLRDGKQASCQAAVATIVAYRQLAGLSVPTSDTGNYCRARAQLPVAALHDLAVEVADAFNQEIGVDLSSIQARNALVWNDTLAKVAQGKAEDMAAPDYFDHVNREGQGINILMHQAGYTLPARMLQNLSDNWFESIQAGQDTGSQAVKSLIVDDRDPKLLHRQHLLGTGDFYSQCVDIGIGVAKNTNANGKFKTCWCFIIAFKE